MKKLSFGIVRLAISLFLIIILIYIMRNDMGKIFSVLKSTRIDFFLYATIVFMAALCAASFRLQVIMDAQKSIALNFKEALSLTYIGYFFNNFLPSAIGGDVVKAYYVCRKLHDKTGPFMAVFVDRAIGLMTMVLMAFVALLLTGTTIVGGNVANAVYLITAISALAIFFMLSRRFASFFSPALKLVRPIETHIRNIYDAVNRYRHNHYVLGWAFLISIISQLLFYASIWIFACSIGSRISFMNILLRMPIIGMMSLLPSINGLGVREGTTVLLFAPLIGEGNAFAVSILWLFVLVIASIIGGLIYGLSPQFKVKLENIKEN